MKKIGKLGRASILAFACVLAVPAPAFAVVNPDPALSKKVPSAVVSLHFADTSSDSGKATQYCTGTVVAPTWVLTAAHCAPEVYDEHNRIYATAIVKGIRVRADVVNVAWHPKFRSTFTMTLYDVALFELAAPIAGVRPISIIGPSDEAALDNPDGLILYGWGIVEHGRPYPQDASKDEMLTHLSQRRTSLPDRPRAVRQLVDDDPGIELRRKLHVATMYLKSDGTMQGSCNGDSGGPLVSYTNGKPRVVAVVSYGDYDCLAKVPGVNARIAPVRDWILSRLNAQREAITPLKVLPDEFREESN